MSVIKKGQTNERRRAWEPPTITKVEIGATKSTHADVSGSAGPQPPSPPATKFGFSFEMAFPMSARFEKQG